MLVVSWNVAGFSKTVDRIHDAYNPAKNTKRQNTLASISLQEFMRRHGADIFCIQEHKIPLLQLSSRSEPRGCSNVKGYESFWACCVDKRKLGFNGVVTYSRKGMVLSADASPLGSQDLDSQGRCVMTDHGNFVLFNVYVPAGGGQPLSYKMKFLQALRRAMKQQRKQKPVMLVGDLNIKHTLLDVFWKDRVVYVHDVLEEVNSARNVADHQQWKRDLHQAWPIIVETMKTMEVFPAQTTNTLTGEKFDKFRLAVTIGDRRVYLGKHERCEDYCLYYYKFDEIKYVDPETNEECVAREGNVVTLGVLTELMAKIAGVNWDHSTQRLIARTSAGVRRVDMPRQWLDRLIQEDGMVDTFRHFYPTAENRFTCWNQETNRRYENEGGRLDYILVDACLLQHVLKGDVPSLRCGATMDNPLGERAALCAATANGAFRPVSFEGEGIGAASQDALDSQFGAPHTGIIYTPPSFSDHVGVSILLDEAFSQRDLVLNEKSAATRKSQPHKMQKSIASFLVQPSANSRSDSSGSLAERFASAKTKKPTEGIKSFFVPRELSNKSEPQRIKLSKRPKLEASNENGPKVTKAANQTKKPAILDLFRK